MIMITYWMLGKGITAIYPKTPAEAYFFKLIGNLKYIKVEGEAVFNDKNDWEAIGHYVDLSNHPLVKNSKNLAT